MSTIGKISVGLEAESTRFSGPLLQAGRDVSALRDNVERLKKAEGGSDFFDKLRQGLGRRSAIGEAAELLKGGGPIGGLNAAAEAIKGMAEQARTLKEEFQSGKLSAGELTEKLISSVPVVGKFWEAGRAIRELFTNEGADLALAETQAKALDEALKAQRGTFEVLKAEAKDYEAHLAEIAHQVVQATGTAEERKEEQARYEEKKSHDDLETQRATALQKIRDKAAPAIKAARDAAAEASKGGAGDSIDNAIFGAIGLKTDEEAFKERQAIAQQNGILAANLHKQQRDAEAQINAHYDDLEAQEKAKTAVVQKAEATKDAQEKSIFTEKAQQEQSEFVKKGAREIADAEAEARTARLRAQGEDLKAEIVERQKHLADRLAAIDQEQQEELAKHHWWDLKEIDQIRETSAKKVAAAREETQAQIQEKQALAAAKDKQKEPTRDQHSAAEVRRFDFNLGKSNKPNGVQGQILEQEKQSLVHTARIRWIHDQLYNQHQNQPNPVVYIF